MSRSDNLSHLSVTQSPFPAGTNDGHHSQVQGQEGEQCILQLSVQVWLGQSTSHCLLRSKL